MISVALRIIFYQLFKNMRSDIYDNYSICIKNQFQATQRKENTIRPRGDVIFCQKQSWL